MKRLCSLAIVALILAACSRIDDQPFRLNEGIWERTSLKIDGAEVDLGDTWQTLRINEVGVTESSDEGKICDSEYFYPNSPTPACEAFVYSTFAKKDSMLFVYDSGKEERLGFKKKGKQITLSTQTTEATYELQPE